MRILPKMVGPRHSSPGLPGQCGCALAGTQVVEDGAGLAVRGPRVRLIYAELGTAQRNLQRSIGRAMQRTKERLTAHLGGFPEPHPSLGA